MCSPQGYPGRPARYPAPLVSADQQSISPEGRAQAEAELKELREVRRPAIVAAIKSAREDGDLSENAEYHTAREEQAMNEARIRTLENLLAAARVVEGETGDVIGVGSRVSFRDGEQVTDVTLVHRLEANPSEGKISTESPVAKALLGGRKGDRIGVSTPRGDKQLEILDVR